MFKKLIKQLMDALSKYSVQQEEVVGIDISEGFVRVAQLDEKDDKWLLSKYAFKAVDDKDGASVSLNKDNLDIYAERVKVAIHAAKTSTKNAALSIPVNSAIVKVVDLPLMSDEELQEAIETDTLWENVVQLTETLDEYSIFWEVIYRSESENRMGLLFVASKISDINFYLDIVKKAGLNPVIVDVRCFALKNALKIKSKPDNENASTGTTAVIEIGGNENYLLIQQEGSPFVSGLFVSDSDKYIFKNPNSSEEVVEQAMQRISMQVKQTIASYQSRFNGLVEEVLLVSPMADLNDKFKSIEKLFAPLKFKLFCPSQHLIIPANLDEKVKAETNASTMSASVGLATRKLDVFGYYQYVTGAQNINLLPDRDSVRQSEKKKLLGKIGGISAAIILSLSIIGILVSQFSEKDKLSKDVSEYEILDLKRMELDTKINELRNKRQKLASTLKASKSISSNQKEMYAVLMQLNGAIPDGVWLDKIQYNGNAKIDIDGKSISDQNILEFIEQLTATKAIERATLKTMNIEKAGSREIKKFSLTISLVEFSKLFTSSTKEGEEK